MVNTAIDSGIATIVSSFALGALNSDAIVANLVRRDFESELAVHGGAVQIQRRGGVNVTKYHHPDGADTDLDSENPGPDAFETVTLSEHLLSHIPISNYYQGLNRPELLAGYGQDLAVAQVDTVDVDLLTQMDTDAAATAIVVPIGDAAALAAAIRTGMATLSANRADRRNRFGAWSPEAASLLLSSAIFTGFESGSTNITPITAQAPAVAGGMPDGGEALRDAILGRRFTFQHLEDQNVQKVDATADTQANMLWGREAVALVTRILPGPINQGGGVARVMSDRGVGMLFTIWWDDRRRHNRMTMDTLYGMTGIRPGQILRITTSEVDIADVESPTNPTGDQGTP